MDFGGISDDEDDYEFNHGEDLDSMDYTYSTVGEDDPFSPVNFNDSDSEDSNSESEDDEIWRQVYEENKIKRNKKEDKNWIPDDITLTSKDKKPIILINSMEEKPEFSEIELATITLNVEIPIRFNLQVIALHLECDNRITGIKCEKVCLKGGMIKKVASKRGKKILKPKKGRKDRDDFYNQCTINIKAEPHQDCTQIINMKLFPNGKIGLTGVKNINHAYESIQYLLTKIENIEGEVMYLTRSYEKGNIKNFRKKLLDAKSNLEFCQPNVNWDDFINSINIKDKQQIAYPDGLPLPPDVSYGLSFLSIIQIYVGDHKDIGSLIKPIIDIPDEKTFYLRNLYKKIQTSYTDEPTLNLKHQKILDIYESANSHPEKPILDEKSKGRFLLTMPAWVNQKQDVDTISIGNLEPILSYFKPENISISNINTKFEYNFTLSRNRLHQILSKKYKQKLCRFEENYGGVNLKYLSRVDCTQHTQDDDLNCIEEFKEEDPPTDNENSKNNLELDNQDDNKLKKQNKKKQPDLKALVRKQNKAISKCQCRLISILIFSNITLITGVRSYFQIMEGHDFITNVMRKEFHKIVKLTKNQPNPIDKFPNVIASDKNVYIKKRHVLNNPKNHFLLTKNNIIELYK